MRIADEVAEAAGSQMLSAGGELVRSRSTWSTTTERFKRSSTSATAKTSYESLLLCVPTRAEAQASAWPTRPHVGLLHGPNGEITDQTPP